MHDTAFRIGSLFLGTYAATTGAIIVEVGAMDVNGSLRAAAPAGSTYIGLDMAPGPGVDIVVLPGAPLPFPDGHADAVLASSVFEHDAAFWITFREMCRITRPGGTIYLSAPSNGTVHRYPLDCWRFYPDAGRALERASRHDGTPVTLLESFVADRDADMWNDFVAVFQRDGGAARCPDRLHRKVACRFVYDVDGPDDMPHEAPTEDQDLLAAAARAPQPDARDDALLGLLRTMAARIAGLERQVTALAQGRPAADQPVRASPATRIRRT